jgi:hypothetical protein
MYVYFFKSKLRKYVIIRLHNLKLDTDIVHIELLYNQKETVSNVTLLLKWRHEINDVTLLKEPYRILQRTK